MRLDHFLTIRNSVFSSKKNTIVIPNVSYGFFTWGEADLIAVTKNGYIIEGEIKASLSDLKKDNEKRKWKSPKWVKEIKKHYYIIPKDILEKGIEFVRPESGIITYEPFNYEFKIKKVREAAVNEEAQKLENDRIVKMCRLASFRYWKEVGVVDNAIIDMDYWKEKYGKALEVIKWYADDLIDHHNYHATMGTVLSKKAKEFLGEI